MAPVIDVQVAPRQAPEHEIDRALHLTRALSEASLAAGTRRRVHTALHPAFGVSMVHVDQVTGYHLLPVAIARQRGGELPYQIGGWRVERVVHVPALEEDDGEWRAPTTTVDVLATTETIEAAVSQLLMDVHRQWLADALDDYACGEYVAGRQ